MSNLNYDVVIDLTHCKLFISMFTVSEDIKNYLIEIVKTKGYSFKVKE